MYEIKLVQNNTAELSGPLAFFEKTENISLC